MGGYDGHALSVEVMWPDHYAWHRVARLHESTIWDCDSQELALVSESTKTGAEHATDVNQERCGSLDSAGIVRAPLPGCGGAPSVTARRRRALSVRKTRPT